MRLAYLCTLGLLLSAAACDSVTEPVYDPSSAHTTAVAAPAASVTAQPAINLPPVQPQPTFWTCAATAEGTFAAEAVQILILEVRALSEPDPYRQAVMLAEVARRKDEAKKVLYFALTQCAAKYPVPYFFAIEDENGNLDIVRFTVGAYHAYLVAKHLEKPE
jgi:hypothetical protein